MPTLWNTIINRGRHHRKFYCSFCKKEVGRLTEATMKKKIEDFPEDLLREWLIETSLKVNS